MASQTYGKAGKKGKGVCFIIADDHALETDLKNVDELVKELGICKIDTIEFEPKSNLSKISKKITEECKARSYFDYILIFILRNRQVHWQYELNDKFIVDIKNAIVVNNLKSFALKPKIIFYQMPLPHNGSNPTTNTTTDQTNQPVEVCVPIELDIMEAFACYGTQDSYSDVNGSYYIQALYNVFKEHIDDGTFWTTYVDDLMYEVNAQVRAFIEEKNKKKKPNEKPVEQTPYIKSSFQKRFLFWK